jgi:uncharacterized iron-regulated membrane protein
LTDDQRPGDRLLRALVNLHFGRSSGMTGKLVWVVLFNTDAGGSLQPERT